MAAYLVEDVHARHRTSVGGCTHFYRTVSCAAGAIGTLEPALGSSMREAYEGDTDAILVASSPGKVNKTGQIAIRLVYALPIASSGGI